LVLGLVLFDITAMVARDVQVGARRTCGEGDAGSDGKKRDAHGIKGVRNSLLGREIASPEPDQASRLWRDCVGNSLSIPNQRKNHRCGHFSALLGPNLRK